MMGSTNPVLKQRSNLYCSLTFDVLDISEAEFAAEARFISYFN